MRRQEFLLASHARAPVACSASCGQPAGIILRTKSEEISLRRLSQLPALLVQARSEAGESSQAYNNVS